MPHQFPHPSPAMALAAFGSAPPPGQRSGAGARSVLPALHQDAERRPDPHGQPAEEAGADGDHTNACSGAREVGKYLVSPLIRALENGWFASAVSIRSGTGSSTTDRVLRLTRQFRSARQAAAGARSEALQWITAAHGLPVA